MPPPPPPAWPDSNGSAAPAQELVTSNSSLGRGKRGQWPLARGPSGPAALDEKSRPRLLVFRRRSAGQGGGPGSGPDEREAEVECVAWPATEFRAELLRRPIGCTAGCLRLPCKQRAPFTCCTHRGALASRGASAYKLPRSMAHVCDEQMRPPPPSSGIKRPVARRSQWHALTSEGALSSDGEAKIRLNWHGARAPRESYGPRFWGNSGARALGRRTFE